MSVIHSSWALLGWRSSLRAGTARCSTVRSIAYSRQASASTASPIHSRRPARVAPCGACRSGLVMGSPSSPLMVARDQCPRAPGQPAASRSLATAGPVSRGVDRGAGGRVRDDQVPGWWHALGLTGLVDVHVHFLPDPVMDAVWDYFDQAERHYGVAWPIHYRTPVEDRLAALGALGVRAFPALVYPHKPGMAAWLSEWARGFAARTPGCVPSGTFYPEPDV